VQYLSNLAMKINAKLEGVNCILDPSLRCGWQKRPYMVLGELFFPQTLPSYPTPKPCPEPQTPGPQCRPDEADQHLSTQTSPFKGVLPFANIFPGVWWTALRASRASLLCSHDLEKDVDIKDAQLGLHGVDAWACRWCKLSEPC